MPSPSTLFIPLLPWAASPGLECRNAMDRAMALDCAHHALMFFNSADLDLLHARPGSFAITPTPGMVDTLRRDYQAMAGMIFGGVPEFADVLEAIRQLEHVINQ